MKYIKNFENVDDLPQVGDYILVKFNSNVTGASIEFIEKTIAKVTETDGKWFRFAYKDVPENIKTYFADIGSYHKDYYGYRYRYYRGLEYPDYVEEFGKTEEELKLKLDAKRYNL